MASGGLRHDFTASDNIRLHETRPFTIPVQDANGDPIPDMSDWEVEWYLVADINDDPRDDPALALVTKADPDLTMITPNVYFTMSEPNDDWAGLHNKPYAYKIWRVDAGHEAELARGDFVIG